MENWLRMTIYTEMICRLKSAATTITNSFVNFVNFIVNSAFQPITSSFVNFIVMLRRPFGAPVLSNRTASPGSSSIKFSRAQLRRRQLPLLGVVLLLGCFCGELRAPRESAPSSSSYLIQGQSTAQAAQAVEAVGGEVTHRLGIIRTVAAQLNSQQRAQLAQRAGLRLYANSPVVSASALPAAQTHRTISLTPPEESARRSPSPPTRNLAPAVHFPSQVGADLLHEQGITGAGVTIAVLDSGLAPLPDLLNDSNGRPRVLARYDAIRDRDGQAEDTYGHGSHITSVLASSAVTAGSDRFTSIAPDAQLVVVKAFDGRGRGTYADVIRGLDWIITQQNTYNVRIVNLSFGAAPTSFYWDDPVNQAVMAVWQAGIAVVAAAGNLGPAPMTVTVPGNLPYAITVGAMTDAFTPTEPGDDYLTTFSSAGPTAEGFVKPELVGLGGHILGQVDPRSFLARRFPERFTNGYFQMSGTSQAAAIVSGTAALVLAVHPELTPDDLKCQLMAAGQAALDAQGQLAYSPLQQGTGLIDAVRAVDNMVEGCANRGLEIGADLAGSEHYAGPVRFDGEDFYIPGHGFLWDGQYNAGGHLWSGGNPWLDGQGNPWLDGQGNPWLDGQGNPWLDTTGWAAHHFRRTLQEALVVLSEVNPQ